MPSAEHNITTPDTGHRTGAPLLATTSAAAAGPLLALGVGLRLSTTGSADMYKDDDKDVKYAA